MQRDVPFRTVRGQAEDVVDKRGRYEAFVWDALFVIVDDGLLGQREVGCEARGQVRLDESLAQPRARGRGGGMELESRLIFSSKSLRSPWLPPRIATS